jgi:hypothetical protein
MATHITNYKIQLHNDLYKFLVCQKCEEVPKYGPIYTCDAGDHATCTDCFQTSKVCKCKAKITNRSIISEEIRTTLPLSCKNRKNGCNIVLTLDSLLCHELNCQFRVIFCPDLNSTKDVPSIFFKNFVDHLTEHHKDINNKITSYNVQGFDVKEDYITPVRMYWSKNISKLTFKNDQFLAASTKC